MLEESEDNCLSTDSGDSGDQGKDICCHDNCIN